MIFTVLRTHSRVKIDNLLLEVLWDIIPQFLDAIFGIASPVHEGHEFRGLVVFSKSENTD